MARIVFDNKEDGEHHEIEVPAGTTLLEAAEKCGAKMGHSCGGVCACSTCHSWIRGGAEALSEQEDREADRLDMAFDVKPISRLGCQSIVEKNDATILVELTHESVTAYYDEHPEERRAREEKLKAGTAPAG
jgi:ferredoxin, 2Fe-2S